MFFPSNLCNKYEDSAEVLVRVSEYFLKADRDNALGRKFLMKAYKLQPQSANISFLCAKYLCGNSVRKKGI
jgi:hypothetical protein